MEIIKDTGPIGGYPICKTIAIIIESFGNWIDWKNALVGGRDVIFKVCYFVTVWFSDFTSRITTSYSASTCFCCILFLISTPMPFRKTLRVGKKNETKRITNNKQLYSAKVHKGKSVLFWVVIIIHCGGAWNIKLSIFAAIAWRF